MRMRDHNTWQWSSMIILRQIDIRVSLPLPLPRSSNLKRRPPRITALEPLYTYSVLRTNPTNNEEIEAEILLFTLSKYPN